MYAFFFFRSSFTIIPNNLACGLAIWIYYRFVILSLLQCECVGVWRDIFLGAFKDVFGPDGFHLRPAHPGNSSAKRDNSPSGGKMGEILVRADHHHGKWREYNSRWWVIHFNTGCAPKPGRHGASLCRTGVVSAPVHAGCADLIRRHER